MHLRQAGGHGLPQKGIAQVVLVVEQGKENGVVAFRQADASTPPLARRRRLSRFRERIRSRLRHDPEWHGRGHETTADRQHCRDSLGQRQRRTSYVRRCGVLRGVILISSGDKGGVVVFPGKGFPSGRFSRQATQRRRSGGACSHGLDAAMREVSFAGKGVLSRERGSIVK